MNTRETEHLDNQQNVCVLNSSRIHRKIMERLLKQMIKAMGKAESFAFHFQPKMNRSEC